MPVLPDWAIQVLQVVVILALAPLISGIIARVEAIIQQRHGPRLLQPYYDIAKLLQKETVLPAPAGPVFRAAPYVSFAAYATVPLLIPALTTFGLPLGYMADFLGVGLILALASFAVSLAAVDSGSPYAQLGSSRLRSFGAFNEPTVIFVTFVLALTTHTDLPYAFGATIRSSTVEVFRPSHLLDDRRVLHAGAESRPVGSRSRTTAARSSSDRSRRPASPSTPGPGSRSCAGVRASSSCCCSRS